MAPDRGCTRWRKMPDTSYSSLSVVNHRRRRAGRAPRGKDIRVAIRPKVADVEDGMKLPSRWQFKTIGHRRNDFGNSQGLREPRTELPGWTPWKLKVLEAEANVLSHMESQVTTV